MRWRQEIEEKLCGLYCMVLYGVVWYRMEWYVEIVIVWTIVMENAQIKGYSLSPGPPRHQHVSAKS